MAWPFLKRDTDKFNETVRNIPSVFEMSIVNGMRSHLLITLRKGGINENFRKRLPSDVDYPSEFAAFFECPLCGETEFRILRRSINCRKFVTACCNQYVSMYIRECPCKDSEGLDCLEMPIINAFYTYEGPIWPEAV
jgi:predicted RNA-binding Zn-ribbon protein involved in translation (DUF1610 family)